MTEQGTGGVEAAEAVERRRRKRAVIFSVAFSVAWSLIATAIAMAVKKRGLAKKTASESGSGTTE